MVSWIKGHMGWLLGLLILIVLCVFLLYSWIDTLVSLDHAHQGQKYQRRQIEVLERLVLETGKRMSRSEIKQVVTQHFRKDYLIKEDAEDEISVDNIILKFRGDSLVEVKSLND